MIRREPELIEISGYSETCECPECLRRERGEEAESDGHRRRWGFGVDKILTEAASFLHL